MTDAGGATAPTSRLRGCQVSRLSAVVCVRRLEPSEQVRARPLLPSIHYTALTCCTILRRIAQRRARAPAPLSLSDFTHLTSARDHRLIPPGMAAHSRRSAEPCLSILSHPHLCTIHVYSRHVHS